MRAVLRARTLADASPEAGDDPPPAAHGRRGQHWAAFAGAADAARRLLARDDGPLLVHCEAGVSRSSAVAAAALAVEEDCPFVDALHDVQDARPHAVPHPALHALGVEYVAARL